MILSLGDVVLRPFDISDASFMEKALNNPNVMRNLRDHIPQPYTVKDGEEFISMCLNESPQKHFGIAYNDILVGSIGLISKSDVYKHTMSVGYWVDEPHWGKGITTLAVKLISDYAFNHLNIHRLQAGVYEYNPGSMKVLEKNGYFHEGIFKQNIFKNGQFYNEYRFAKLKETNEL